MNDIVSNMVTFIHTHSPSRGGMLPSVAPPYMMGYGYPPMHMMAPPAPTPMDTATPAQMKAIQRQQEDLAESMAGSSRLHADVSSMYLSHLMCDSPASQP